MGAWEEEGSSAKRVKKNLKRACIIKKVNDPCSVVNYVFYLFCCLFVMPLNFDYDLFRNKATPLIKNILLICYHFIYITNTFSFLLSSKLLIQVRFKISLWKQCKSIKLIQFRFFWWKLASHLTDFFFASNVIRF